MEKKILGFLILFLIIVLFLINFPRNVYYNNYIEKIITEGNVEIKLIKVIWDDGENYKINEDVNIINEIQKIMISKYSNEPFWRGGNYLIFVFNIYDKGKIIEMEMKLHDIKPVVELTYNINKVSVYFERELDNFDIINKIKEEIKY
jgi:hypothetical protein